LPPVSILLPARNEAGRVLARCVASILAQDYGRLEIIAVDDRSTDSTPEILGEFAAGDRRLKLIKGVDPPSGWLGKPWALRQALEHCQSDWLLATDADMIFHPAAVSTALSHALQERYDALTLIPRFDTPSFWERVFVPTWLWRLLLLMVVGGLNDPARRKAKAMGGFLLLRRAALERCGGFGAVKSELVEDVRLAELLKNTGARLRIEYAPDLISTRMYSDFIDLWQSCSRNWYALVNYSLSSAIALVAATFAAAVAPPLSAGLLGLPLLFGEAVGASKLFAAGVCVWIFQVLGLVLVNWRHRIPVAYALATPLGFALQCAILINSAVRIGTARSVTWKERRINRCTDGSVIVR
jgi:cellulose synthase/poly-beta-1,6-N-acetylglucosamine synthase-like glycosyltransferase